MRTDLQGKVMTQEIFPSLSKTKESLYAQLSQSKMRKKHGMFVAEGEKCVSDTIGHFEVVAVIVAEGVDIPEVLRQYADKICLATAVQMRHISSLTALPGVIAVYRIPESVDREVDENKLYVMLDGVQDPGNLGTIVRTCHWFGIDTIYASRDTVDIFNPKSVQATMGSIAAVKVVYCDLATLISMHPSMPVYGLQLDGEDIYRSKLENRGFILMGNEGNGISRALRSTVTSPLCIPPATDNHGESLNVAIATAITLALFVRNEC